MKCNNIMEIHSDIEKVKSLLLSNVCLNNPEINEAVNKFIKAPSKFLRPRLCCLIQRAMYGCMEENVLLSAAAIELAHNASLLHDDVIDDSDKRRNYPSFNYEFGTKKAILAGDWMLSKAMSILNTINHPDLYKLFAVSIQKMSEGELSQLFSKYKIPSLKDYYDKNQNKTGQLFKISVLAPLILRDDMEFKDSLENFVFYFSNAFQIYDDISDYFGLNLDKPSHIDNKHGIYTLPDILIQDSSNENLYEECCKILRHQVNLSVESLNFLKDSLYKETLISLCLGLLKD